MTPAIDIHAFMGGVGVGLAVFFVALLLVGGAILIRRMIGA